MRFGRARTATAATVLAALVAGACGSEGDADRLPDVTVIEIGTGDEVSLADVDGPAVVNLWATTCAPCVREIPAFEAVHRELGRDVRFVGINIAEDEDRAAEFLDELGATYDQYLDPLGYVVTELGTSAMPITLVIDADERIVTRHLGAMDESDLRSAIDDALSGSA